MRISRFERLTSNEVVPLEMPSWAAFVEHLGEHRYDYRDKQSVPLVSPAEYPEGKIRRKENVSRVHFGALDLDGLTDEQLDQVLERAQHLEFVFYTTWSHHERPNCARLFFPFTRPVESIEWSSFWPRMRAHFLNICDAKCSDASRIFFYPSAPAGTEEHSVYATNTGEAFDVDAVLHEALTIESSAVDRTPLQHKSVEMWAKGIRVGQNPHLAWVKEKLLLLLTGQALAEEGERDTTVFKLVSAIIGRFPDATAESVAALFDHSAKEMNFEIDLVLEKVKRRISEEDQARVARENEQLREVQTRISQAFSSSRTRPYSPQEVEAFAHSQGCTVDEFKTRWVIQRDGSYWIFVDGQYKGPFTQLEVSNAARIFLAPAASLGVDTEKFLAKGGKRMKNGTELVQDYGRIAAKINIDLSAQRSTFDAGTATLVEAPCPRRLLDVEEHPNVAEWLRLLGGPEHAILLDWIASVTRLEDPCSALYLEGPKGAGKTLLANGLAAIWTVDGPVPLEDAFANFNSQMLKCPLVFGDEVMPTDITGRGRTGQLRQFVQARERTLRRKYVADSSLRGCIRLMLAANNKDMISTSEHLTVNDIEAIVDRVLHIHVTEAPAAFLRDVRITPDEIASHALWLAATRKVESKHRFLVPGTKTELHRTLTTNSGLRSAVCHWLVAYVHEPQKVDATRTGLVVKKEEKLYATSRGLARFWEMYETNQDPPPIGLISRALSGLATSKKRLMTDGAGRRTWFWEIDTDMICAWSEDNGYAQADELREMLKVSTEERRETN